jgi:TIR domain
MKVFINYSHKDEALATELADRLEAAGLDPWFDKREILPGDNWAEKTSEGLKESNAMVVLLTPNSVKSEPVQANVSFALSDKSFRHRVIPVVVGDFEESGPERIPWILKKLKPVSLVENKADDNGFDEIVQALKDAA